MKDDDIPMSELLKPLSAKVMPQAGRMTRTGAVRDQTRLENMQRQPQRRRTPPKNWNND